MENFREISLIFENYLDLQQPILEVFFDYNWSKNVLKHLSTNDIEYPFFKNMSFRNANSWKLVQLKQIEEHLKAKV